MSLLLLISPLCKGAYFADVQKISQIELSTLYPDIGIEYVELGTLAFWKVELSQEEIPHLLRLSFVQGIFEFKEGLLLPIEAKAPFELPEELVWGSKYRGKTHEIVSQLALNIALSYSSHENPKILDPMAGRGTTILWAARYGLSATGIEIDPTHMAAFYKHCKTQTKMQRIKHKMSTGFLGKKNRNGMGEFCTIQWGGITSKLITGDSSDMDPKVFSEKFHLLITDLPYGIQFHGSANRRNPIDLIAHNLQKWPQYLHKNGIGVLIFNSLQPRRTELITLIEAQNLEVVDFQADHRMSESILRDIVVFRKR